MTAPLFRMMEGSFGSRKRRGITFGCGLLAQATLIGASVLAGMIYPEQLSFIPQRVVFISLAPPEPAPVLKPLPRVVRTIVPRLKPQPVPDPPLLAMAKPDLAAIQPPLPPLTISVPRPPSPSQIVPPHPPVLTPPKVNTGNFGGAPVPVTTKRPPEQVQTGGFGNPQGLPGSAQGKNPGNVPKLGSFGFPEGAGVGNGSGGGHGIPGAVASAGFGSGMAGGGYGHDDGGIAIRKVALGGFGNLGQVAQPLRRGTPLPLPVEFQPVELLSKPSPVYSEEARHLGIQGDVILSVIFLADGALQINGVVNSLGHGLDQAAKQAAAQIRFKPAQHNGKPVDFPATLRIEFRLADQTT